MSQAQQLLEQGKYLITPFEGYWHMILPPTSWLVELMGDNIFRTGFSSEVSEEDVREFYVERLNVRPDEIERAGAA
jgi:hypothetical protein